MSLPYVDINKPGDSEAELWLDRREAYADLASSRPRALARVYSWAYEADTWLMAFMSSGLLWLNGGWFIGFGMLVAAYWTWACTRTTRIHRQYARLIHEGRILSVPTSLVELYFQAAPKLDDDAKSVLDEQDLRVRFHVLKEVMRNHADLVEIIARDCGCQVPCTHPGRLAAERSAGAVTRTGMHRRMRKIIASKLAQNSEA